MKGHFGQSVSGELPILIGTIPVRHVQPPQNSTVVNQDYLVPPHPTPLKKDDEIKSSLQNRNNSR